MFFRLVPDMVISLSDFLDAAAMRWPSALLIRDQQFDGKDEVEVRLGITDREPPFSIYHRGDLISTDGVTEQVAVVAVWLRSLLPEQLEPPLLMSDNTDGTLRELPATITLDEVWDPTDWVDEADYAATHPSD